MLIYVFLDCLLVIILVSMLKRTLNNVKNTIVYLGRFIRKSAKKIKRKILHFTIPLVDLGVIHPAVTVACYVRH